MDFTIRGAGIFGLSIAWVAVRRGARVRVIDPGGVASGASGGPVGALAPHTPDNWNTKKAFQLESLLMAEQFWTEVEAASGIASGYARLGRLQPLADERAITRAHQRETDSTRNWKRVANWRIVDVESVGPWAPATPTGQLIFDDLSARLQPVAACDSLAAAIVSSGGELVSYAEDEGDIVWATGASGLADLSESVGHAVGSGVKGQAALLHFDAGDVPQIFADGVHVIPHFDGTVAVGSTSERDYDDAFSTDTGLEALVERAAFIVPALHGARVVRRWAGVRPRATTRAPILGRHPKRRGHFIANGGFKIGFGIAPKVAEVIVDLVLEGHDVIPEEFRVENVL